MSFLKMRHIAKTNTYNFLIFCFTKPNLKQMYQKKMEKTMYLKI